MYFLSNCSFEFQGSDFDSSTSNTSGSAPRLIVVDGRGFLCGFGMLLPCTGPDFISHLLDLMAAYYAWDIS